MDLGLKGKSAIITGASKGIGRSTALTLAAEGANVAICARGQKALDSTAKEIKAHGVKAYAASCDVANADALNVFLNDARKAFGGIDILVNNTSAVSLSDDEAGWKDTIDIDILPTVRATRTVAPWIAEAGGGAIVYISSISALEAGVVPAYAAAKAAHLAHAKSMAMNLAAQNIRVNCVVPGSTYFEGGFWAMVEQNDADMYREIVSTIPFGRMGTPEEIANAITFIASPKASWVSGATLLVDGVQHKGIY